MVMGLFKGYVHIPLAIPWERSQIWTKTINISLENVLTFFKVFLPDAQRLGHAEVCFFQMKKKTFVKLKKGTFALGFKIA